MLGRSRIMTRFRDAAAGFASISSRMPPKTAVQTEIKSVFILPKPQPPLQCSEERQTTRRYFCGFGTLTRPARLSDLRRGLRPRGL